MQNYKKSQTIIENQKQWIAGNHTFSHKIISCHMKLQHYLYNHNLQKEISSQKNWIHCYSDFMWFTMNFYDAMYFSVISRCLFYHVYNKKMSFIQQKYLKIERKKKSFWYLKNNFLMFLGIFSFACYFKNMLNNVPLMMI